MASLAFFLEKAEKDLLEAGVPSARWDVEWLAEHVTGIPRLELPLFSARRLTEEEARRLADFVVRRCRREPLQHLIGWVSFLGLEIESGRAAFIPRPETEALAEQAIWRLKQWKGSRKVLDLGTGTGCLSVAIACAVEGAVCWAVDLSPQALALARRNVDRHGLANRIHLVRSNWFSQLPASLEFDLIVSNPPYIPRLEIAFLPPEVRDYDPRLALDGGGEGLDFYKVIASGGRRRLTAEGGAMVEFGDGQQERVQGIFEAKGWKYIQRHLDYAGVERILECNAS